MNKNLLIANMQKIKALQADVQQLRKQLEQMNRQQRRFKKPKKSKKYKITLTEFLNPNTVTIVNTRTQEQYDKLVNACQEIKGKSFFSNSVFNLYKKQTCLRYGVINEYNDIVGYCDKDWYLLQKCKVYDFSEIDLHK